MSTTTLPLDPAAGATATAARAEPVATTKRRSWMLTVLVAGQFMTNVDAAIVNVAGRTIQERLHASGAGLELIISGYVISYAALLVIGARLGADRGHRRMFIGGLVGFVATSLLCGLAPTTGALIAARLAQGASAAMMIPQVLSLIQKHHEGPARARALSVFAAAIALGFVVGQVLGGVLVSADLFGLSWRSVFLVNVPVGAVLVLAAARHLPAHPTTERQRIDLGGSALLLVAMLSFVLPLVLGREEGWPTWAIASLVATPFLLRSFVWFEHRELRSGRLPLFDLTILKDRRFAAAVASQFLVLATFAGHLFALAIFIQGHLGAAPAVAGLCFVPMGTAFAATNLSWPRLSVQVQRRALPAGLALAAAGYVLTGLVLADRTQVDIWTALVPAVGAFGLGFGSSPLIGRALSQVRPDQIASASGLVTTGVQTSMVVGIATLGSLFLSRAGTAPADALRITFLAAAAAAAISAVLATRLR